MALRSAAPVTNTAANVGEQDVGGEGSCCAKPRLQAAVYRLHKHKKADDLPHGLG